MHLPPCSNHHRRLLQTPMSQKRGLATEQVPLEKAELVAALAAGENSSAAACSICCDDYASGGCAGRAAGWGAACAAGLWVPRFRGWSGARPGPGQPAPPAAPCPPPSPLPNCPLAAFLCLQTTCCACCAAATASTWSASTGGGQLCVREPLRCRLADCLVRWYAAAPAARRGPPPAVDANVRFRSHESITRRWLLSSTDYSRPPACPFCNKELEAPAAAAAAGSGGTGS